MIKTGPAERHGAVALPTNRRIAIGDMARPALEVDRMAGITLRGRPPVVAGRGATVTFLALKRAVTSG